jgi:hypothetical protein
MIFMPKSTEDIEKELEKMKYEVKKLSLTHGELDKNADIQSLITYLIDEREKTNKALERITQKIVTLEKEFENTGADDGHRPLDKVLLSDVDAKIINFVQTQDMACAEDVCKFMNYNGKNAASARLNKLHKERLLERFQLGHTVYYRFDAGKTTETLIISPPQ